MLLLTLQLSIFYDHNTKCIFIHFSCIPKMSICLWEHNKKKQKQFLNFSESLIFNLQLTLINSQ